MNKSPSSKIQTTPKKTSSILSKAGSRPLGIGHVRKISFESRDFYQKSERAGTCQTECHSSIQSSKKENEYKSKI